MKMLLNDDELVFVSGGGQVLLSFFDTATGGGAADVGFPHNMKGLINAAEKGQLEQIGNPSDGYFISTPLSGF
ncbi:MAG: hypothetical protein K0Q74_1123 [Gammaproteobacteria bacterium]|jgi:hypothetical protein|nr:hypothetical protein [Gammaproteobacteria bacterium]